MTGLSARTDRVGISHAASPCRRAILGIALALSAIGAGASEPSGKTASRGGEDSPGSPSPIVVESLNAGLPRLAQPPDLETPQSSLESFIGACRRGDHARAAHS